MKKKHGGRRENAGRQTPDGAQGVKHYNVTLDLSTVERAKHIGFGSLSLGLRKAVKAYP